MQVVSENHPVMEHPSQTGTQLMISLEVVAWVLLVLFAFAIRVAELDTIPLSDTEAIQALAAWHTLNPDAPGTALSAQSPVIFWFQTLSLSFLGGSEFAVRISGLIGGLVLMLMPLLFRQKLGTSKSFLAGVLLACSPIALLASRYSDPSIWIAVAITGLLWAVWQYYADRRLKHAYWLIAFATLLIFLAGPGGVWLAGLLLIAILIALWWTAFGQPEDLDLEHPQQDIVSQARIIIRDFPAMTGFVLMVGLVLIISTGFMLYPGGLNIVAENLSQSLRGFTQPAYAGAPAGLAILTLLVFNPLLLISGIVGAIMLLRQERVTFAGRFLIVWTLLTFLFLLVYRGADSGAALWLVLPLIGLSVIVLDALFVDRPVLLYWLETLDDDEEMSDNRARYAWIKWLIGAIVLGLLMILSVHWGEVVRALQMLPYAAPLSDVISILTEPAYVEFRYSGIWLLISLLFMIVGFLLVASLWGNDHALQGFGIGVFFFMIGAGTGGGWTAAVVNADEPMEFWHETAVSGDVLLLRDTLYEVAQRQTRGFPLLEIDVLLDPDSGVTDHGLLAWTLRDFENTNFVRTLDDIQQQGVILLPAGVEQPDLGGTYVGQSFMMRTYRAPQQMVLLDVPAWLVQRRIRPQDLPQDTMVLWLRQDVFDGVRPDNQ